MLERKYFGKEQSLAYLEYPCTWDYQDSLPDLVIFHGLFGMADNWHSIAQLLQEGAKRMSLGLRILVPDLPGHGYSNPSPSYDYQTLAKLLGPFCESRGTVLALGHSMGGKLALELTAHYSAFLAGILVVDIVPKVYPDWHTPFFDALLGLDVHNLRSRSQAGTILADAIPDGAVRSFLLKNLVQNGDSGFSWLCDLRGLSRDYAKIRGWSGNLPDISLPTAWIIGEESPYVTPADSELIEKVAPGSRLYSIPGAGHWVHAENRDGFIQSVWEFLHYI